MSRAAPFDCDVCGRRIGKTSTHLLTDNGKVCCLRCAEKRSSHAAVYPDCSVPWHDMYNHDLRHATRAGARWWLTQQLGEGEPMTKNHRRHWVCAGVSSVWRR